jgi:hypothetical protein
MRHFFAERFQPRRLTLWNSTIGRSVSILDNPTRLAAPSACPKRRKAETVTLLKQ